MGKPYTWTSAGLPVYRSRGAPPFLMTEAQLANLGLLPGEIRAFVESQYEPARLFLVTEARVRDSEDWPPQQPA